LGVHPDAVRNAIESERFHNSKPLGVSVVDPYIEFIRHTLDQHPRLRATRIYQMIRDRGYGGSVVQLRRTVARLRPQFREAFLQLQMFPGEQAQVDWAHFGHVMVGRAKRALSCFVMTLSYSRALYLEFFFDQTMENFLRGHVHAFEYWPGQPRVILYDNLKSAVLERRSDKTNWTRAPGADSDWSGRNGGSLSGRHGPFCVGSGWAIATTFVVPSRPVCCC
jgi:transposase